jgi:CelD/BcsL family acetyltransferase involved in cellulose biosynthesis
MASVACPGSRMSNTFALPPLLRDQPLPAPVDERAPASHAVRDPVTVGKADGLQLDIIRTRAGFDSLESEWNALFAAAGRSEHMFLTFNWLWHWANHYLPASAELAIVTGRRNGRLVLIWPLLIERTAGLRQLAFMGAPVSQYGDVLIADMADKTSALEHSWSFMLQMARPDLVRFTKVRSDATIAPLLAGKGFRTTSTEEAPAATLSAAPTYADFEQRFSPKLRKNRRRQLRRLEERGPVEIKVLAGTAEAAGAARATMTLKRAWLNSRGLVSKAFADVRIDAFFADAVSSTTRPCGVEISQLSSNGECADVSISVTCKGRRAIHILAYALKFEKVGAGNHHLEVALQKAYADGIEIYDFLAPRHEYKMEWADTVVAVSDHALALSPLGKLYADIYLARVREGIKRVLKTLPRGVTRFIAGAHRSTHGVF